MPSGSAGKHKSPRDLDLVYSTFVLQHLSDAARQQIIAEVARVLRPRGLFIFQFPISPRKSLGGVTWHLVPLGFMMWIQRSVLRFPAPMPMHWFGTERVKKELGSEGLAIAGVREDLTYSPHWRDAWYFATKR